MKHIYYIIAIIIFAVISSCEKDARILDNTKIGTSNEFTNNKNDIVDGVIRVKLSPEIANQFPATKSNIITKSGNNTIDSYMQQIGAKSMKRAVPFDPEYEDVIRKAGAHLWYDIEFDSSMSVLEVTEQLKHTQGILIVENIYKLVYPEMENSFSFPIISSRTNTKANSTYKDWSDPELYKQWNYNNDGKYAPESIAGADINLFKAWEIETGKSDVIVAVLDSGVDGDHQDLTNNMWRDDEGRYGYNFITDSYTIVPEFHGTHVAGTIAATNNNGIGVCGIAGGNGTPGSGVRIMSCQVSSKTKTADTKGIYNAFVYAAKNGAVIAQNSWNCFGAKETPPSIKEGIEFFINNAKSKLMKGGVVIFSAGNDGSEQLKYPACEENVIAVAAMQSNFKKTGKSNYGEWVDITAPGGIMDRRAHIENDVRNDILSTYYPYGETGTGYEGGTSMASPHVSGIAALIISHFGNENFTNNDLKKRLLTAVSKYDIYDYNPTLKDKKKLGVGLIDAFAALAENKEQAPDAVANVITTPSLNSIKVEWQAVSDKDDLTAFRYNIYYSQSNISSDNTGEKHIVEAEKIEPGELLSTTINGLMSNTKYYFAIEAEDRWELKSPLKYFEATTISNTGDQTLSIVKPIDAVSLEVNGNKSINLGDFFNDSKGNTITYTVTSDNKSVADATVNGATLNVKAVGEGSCNITVTANNGKNETLSSSFKVTVSKNGGSTPDNEVLAKLTSASPVSDILSVKINSRVNSCNLVIAGATGKVFVNKDLSFGSDAERNLNINVAKLAAGAYVLKVSSNGETFTQHFVKL